MYRETHNSFLSNEEQEKLTACALLSLSFPDSKRCRYKACQDLASKRSPFCLLHLGKTIFESIFHHL